MLLASSVSPELVSALGIIRPILLGILTICCISVIITTLLQSSANPAGSSAISGGESESYFSQNHDNSRDGRLKRATIVMASIGLGALVLFFCTGFIYTLNV